MSSGEEDAVRRFLLHPDSETYAGLFRAFISQVAGYFGARGCRPPSDEDLAQDVMLTIYRQSHSLRDHNLFRPWLFKIARNVLLQYRRRDEARHPVEPIDRAGPAHDPLAAFEFSRWLAVLNAEEREALTLRYVEGLEYHEIAEVLGIPVGTIQWRVFQSKKKLTKRFGRPS